MLNDEKAAQEYTLKGYHAEHGIGRIRSARRAFYYYQKAATKKDPLGMHNLALCYYKGIGTKKDEIKALTLLHELQLAGLSLAKKSLGLLLLKTKLNCQFCEDPKAEAFKLLSEAFNEGEKAAVLGLALCYEEGHGTIQDFAEALALYRLAESFGLEVPGARIQHCLSQLSKIDPATRELRPFFESSKRLELMTALRDTFFYKKSAAPIFIMGVPGSGKSHLIDAFLTDSAQAREIKAQNLQLIRSSMKTFSQPQEIYSDLGQQLFDQDYNLSELIEKLKTHTGKAIWILDSAEALPQIFKNKILDYHAFCSFIKNPSLGIIPCFLSRLSPHEIDYKITADENLLQRICDLQCLSQLSYEDLAELVKAEDFDLASEDLVSLYHFTGGHPALLNLYLSHLPAQKDIGQIYRIQSVPIHAIYQSFKAWLQELGVWNIILELCLDPFSTVEREQILDLINLDRFHHNSESFVLSPHFTSSLKDEPLHSPLIVKVLETEKNLKKIIRRETEKIYNAKNVADWNRAFYMDFQQLNWDLYQKFMVAERASRANQASYLNVLSLKDSLKVIERYWELYFKNYFNLDDWDQWQDIFWLCARKRNPLAHGQEDRLLPEERKQLSRACDKINRSILSVLGPEGKQPAAMLEVPPGSKAFFYPERLSRKGGLFGYFYYAGIRVKALLPKESFSKLPVEKRPRARGQAFPVEIIKSNKRRHFYFVQLTKNTVKSEAKELNLLLERVEGGLGND